MTEMYAVLKDKPAPGAAIRRVDVPRIGSGDVLVKVERAAICGTDLHIFNWDVVASFRIRRIPLIFGHEFSGVVVDKGENVTKVDVGDSVSGETHIADGECYQCRTGRMHICRNLKILGVDVDGAFAEYVVVPELNAWKNDKSLDPRIAALQEPLGCAVHAIYPRDHVEPVAGKTVLVMGCGPIGLMSIAVLKTVGAERVFAAEVSEYRLKFAERMGADVVINPSKEDVGRIVMEETGGRGVDVVLEMSGAEESLKTGLGAVTPGGRVSILGIYTKMVSLEINTGITLKGITVHGIYGRRMFQTWHQVKGLLNVPSFRGKIKSLITHEFKMSEIEEAVKLLNSKEAVKIVLDPKFN
nr:L-threonine 3-dehydrogenase [Candidatus Freyrarchaeum guaymaensis]